MGLATLILAAGKGKRMKYDLPKVLHPLNKRPIIHYVIDVAESIGSDKVVLVIGYKKELIIEATQNRKVEFAVQEKQLGTGHAVLQTKKLFKGYQGDLLILSGDVPLITSKTIENLYRIHQKENPLATILTTKVEDPTRYGRIVRDVKGHLCKIVEDKDADHKTREIKEINAGIYIFRCFELFETLPKISNENFQNEYYLTDVINIYLENDEHVVLFPTKNKEETHGIDNIEQLKEAEKILFKRTIN